jgi:hypothetical protein
MVFPAYVLGLNFHRTSYPPVNLERVLHSATLNSESKNGQRRLAEPERKDWMYIVQKNYKHITISVQCAPAPVMFARRFRL